MATYSISPASGTAGHPSKAPDLKCVSVVVDFSSTTNAANDVFECITLPANTYVVTAGIDVMTADTAGNSGTISLGDGSEHKQEQVVWVLHLLATAFMQQLIQLIW